MNTDVIALDPHWLAGHAALCAVVMARVGGACLTAPVTAVPGAAMHMRVLLSLMLGALLIPILEPMIGSLEVGPMAVWLALLDLVVGGLLGLSAALIVAAARQAGDLVAAHAGLSASALLDPETGDELTPLGHLYGLIALAVFLAMEGPLVLVGALVESYRIVPVGGLSLKEATGFHIFAQVGAALALALRAAAPVAIALVVAGLIVGWIGRLAPAVPLLALSLPVRSLLGIILVFLSLVTLAAILTQAWSSWPWRL